MPLKGFAPTPSIIPMRPPYQPPRYGFTDYLLRSLGTALGRAPFQIGEMFLNNYLGEKRDANQADLSDLVNTLSKRDQLMQQNAGVRSQMDAIQQMLQAGGGPQSAPAASSAVPPKGMGVPIKPALPPNQMYASNEPVPPPSRPAEGEPPKGQQELADVANQAVKAALNQGTPVKEVDIKQTNAASIPQPPASVASSTEPVGSKVNLFGIPEPDLTKRAGEASLSTGNQLRAEATRDLQGRARYIQQMLGRSKTQALSTAYYDTRYQQAMERLMQSGADPDDPRTKIKARHAALAAMERKYGQNVGRLAAIKAIDDRAAGYMRQAIDAYRIAQNAGANLDANYRTQLMQAGRLAWERAREENQIRLKMMGKHTGPGYYTIPQWLKKFGGSTIQEFQAHIKEAQTPEERDALYSQFNQVIMDTLASHGNALSKKDRQIVQYYAIHNPDTLLTYLPSSQYTRQNVLPWVEEKRKWKADDVKRILGQLAADARRRGLDIKQQAVDIKRKALEMGIPLQMVNTLMPISMDSGMPVASPERRNLLQQLLPRVQQWFEK